MNDSFMTLVFAAALLSTVGKIFSTILPLISRSKRKRNPGSYPQNNSHFANSLPLSSDGRWFSDNDFLSEQQELNMQFMNQQLYEQQQSFDHQQWMDSHSVMDGGNNLSIDFTMNDMFSPNGGGLGF